MSSRNPREDPLRELAGSPGSGFPDQHLGLVFDEGRTDGLRSELWWTLPAGEGRTQAMSYRLLQKLRIPLKLRPEIFRVEKERRQLMEDYEKSAEPLGRIKTLSEEAWKKSRGGLAEGEKDLVDEYDQPIRETDSGCPKDSPPLGRAGS